MSPDIPAGSLAILRLALAGAFTVIAGQAAAPLETTYWRATELGGKPVPGQNAAREAHLLFQPDGRLTGSDGCNRISGSYQVKVE